MLERVTYVASALTSLGLAGKFITVSGDTHPDYFSTEFGTVASDGVIIPLDKDINADQFVGFNEMCDVECVVYTPSLDRKIAETADRLPKVKYFIRIGGKEEDLPKGERYMTFEAFLALGTVIMVASFCVISLGSK